MKKKLQGLMILLVGIMLVFALTGCDLDDVVNDIYDWDRDDGTTWPSGKLSEFGASGWSMPAGMTNIKWDYAKAKYMGIEAKSLGITFNGTEATEQAIEAYFSGNGWSGSSGTYTKGSYEAGYSYYEGEGWITFIYGDRGVFD